MTGCSGTEAYTGTFNEFDWNCTLHYNADGL